MDILEKIDNILNEEKGIKKPKDVLYVFISEQ